MGRACGEIATCAASVAVREIGSIRQQIDTVIVLLESALDQGESMADESQEKRKGMALARMAVESVQRIEAQLGQVEDQLSHRILERLAGHLAAAGCAPSGAARTCC